MIISFSKTINIKKANKIVDEINETIQQWSMYADKVGVYKNQRDTIQKTILKLK